MSKNIIILLLILLSAQIANAQISVTTSTTSSTCSANGAIHVDVNGGTAPYLYQIISSSTGIIRPAQNINVFQNLPAGSYTIRVTDRNNLTATNNAIISGNYLPLNFSSVQQQSTIIIQPVNGKRPYTFSYSADGGSTFSVPKDTNAFDCLTAGSYLFRVYDSCSNFYTETVVVAPVAIQADFSCVANIASSTKSVVLNSIVNGNGGFSYNAFGVNYNQTNTTGNFSNINRCNKNISVKVTDRCNVTNTFVVCPTPDYTYAITCVNFKDKKVTIGNVSSGSGLPYQYIANDVASNSTTVQNFPITADTILAGLIDSCGFKNTIEIRRMNVLINNQGGCQNGTVELFTFYTIDGKGRSFQPTVYTSVSGPTSFSVTDTSLLDTSTVNITGLESGKYVYKITNACGDEVLDSFIYSKKCFKSIRVLKYQTCTSLKIRLEKDCRIDTNTLYTLKTMQGAVVGQNTNGIFDGLNNDSCYQLEMHQMDCDTILTDIIQPKRPKLKIFQISCSEISLTIQGIVKKFCGNSLGGFFIPSVQFVLLDSSYNILLTSNSGYINAVPPDTYWIFAQTAECNSDTLKYTRKSGFEDSIQFCITPTVRLENNRCRMAWNVKLLNNQTNTTFTLSGNGTNVQGIKNFYGIDSGLYILKNGCQEQELFLPDYYHFKTVINPGCPSNASVTASYSIDTAYMRRLSAQYLYYVCEEQPIDYNIKEVGSSTSLTYSTTGHYNNLKTGTFYAIFFKGNEECNFHSDTIFTPFYTRPALKATYGLICNGNNATVKASVVGGTPPYTYEVLNTAIPQIITDSSYVLYNSLPLGTAQFRVNDACGISTDYSTEVLSVNFQPTFKKKCNGQVQLIAPDIFNTTYVWTNKQHDTIGTTPIVYTYPNGDDTFTVSIKHLSCNISKSLFVSDFSASIVVANAGFDFATDTTTTNLPASSLPHNATGTWKQIDPSSGNTVFADTHNPHTTVTVDVFPGQYTYVWTVTDTTIGCISEDTIVVSFLRCPNIRPVLYTKTIQEPVCINNGKIELNITQASTPVHFLWNTGDTTSVLQHLKDTVYIVIISDETSCTPDITDTIVLNGTQHTSFILYDTICNGDTLRLLQKKYYTTGTFFDTITNNAGCDSLLQINLLVLPVNHIYDTISLCENETYQLPDNRIITQAGNYTVHFSNIYGCDSLLHFHIISITVQHTEIDTFICAGTSYLLPDGSMATTTGLYTDTLSNFLGCDSIILTNLLVRDTLKNLSLGIDTLICNADQLLLTLHFPDYVKYLWQDATTQNSLVVNKAGIYYVKIQDGCTNLADTLKVDTRDCSCTFYIPTAFSPNNDGVNDIFKPFPVCIYYKDYSLSVYNRWGELVFESKDTNTGWNGIFKNNEQPVDNYLWTIGYFDSLQNTRVYQKGMLTLLR